MDVPGGLAPEPGQGVLPARRWVERSLGTWNALVFLAWAAGPFFAAGDAGWPRGWAHLLTLAACVVIHRGYVTRRDPDLLRRRRRIGAGTRGWDLWWNALFWPLMAAIAVAAGLDARRGAGLAVWSWPVGAALLAVGFALSAAAMAVNPFFEGTVRIQSEAGHHPVEAGPYARIRHPGYAGLVLWACATPLLLGSARAFAAALVAAAWVVLRTALEDAMLRRELPGYLGYAGRVRWRLVPGLW
jgi:protein-S-isoprenylcysteine O-methyltransferase Ste14